MARELERRGLLTAMITSLPIIARRMGVNRIIQGSGIPYPLGAPGLPGDQELQHRLRILRTALGALGTAVTAPTVFGA
jgi:glycine/betaine/sarcosine/D-proline reductase family selenoprotein B